MKNSIIIIIIYTCLCGWSQAFAQNRTITGTVRDLTGVLPGATIREKNVENNMASSDQRGRFTLSLQGQSNTVIVKLLGFADYELVLGRENYIDVTLQPSNQGLDEVIVVGFGTTKKITNTGAVSSVSGAEIRNVPTANVQNTLMGRMPGFVSQQRSGQPGRDASDFFIRGVSSLNSGGNRPLILVDDIEYSYDQLQQINVNEIENITILKDASTTAIYGIKGANGVLIVTTRRGSAGKPQINLRLESGIQNPIRTPQFLNSYESAKLINEAFVNDGLPERFSERQLQLFQDGSDPYGHPDVNWYREIFKNVAAQTNANLDLSGGSESLRYFISGGALTQGGLVRDFDDPYNEVNTNYFFRRYNFRSNLDLRATKTLQLRFDLSTRFADINQPNSLNAVGEIYDFSKITPFSAPFINPNGSYAYAFSEFNPDALPTLNARLANGGYNRTKRSDYNALLQARQQLDFITRGLVLTARIAYGGIEEYARGIARGGLPPSYHYNSANDSYQLDPRGRYVLEPYGVFGNTNQYYRNLNIQGFINYDRDFGDHRISSLLLVNQQSVSAQANVPENFRGTSLKLGYNYKEKYLLDVNTAYNGTDRFAKDQRYGWFPAVGIGWVASKESFIQQWLPKVNLLKVRASFGLVGSDVTSGGRYLYNQIYENSGGYVFGTGGAGVGTIREGELGNMNVTWEKEWKRNVGLELNLFNQKLNLTVDYFYNTRFDQLIRRGSVPGILGIGFAPTNVARTVNRGFDGIVSYRSQIGQVGISSDLVFQVFRNKVLYQDEASPAFPWLARTGQPIDQPFGYLFDGFYTSEDIAQIYTADGIAPVGSRPPIPLYGLSPTGQGGIQEGDLKYRDLNGDGFIDDRDQAPIGRPNLPSTVLGLTLGANYKGFSANILLQGSFDYSFDVIGTGIEPFQSQFQPIHQQRYTPGNPQSAAFPRLTQNPTTVNSARAYRSDFWLLNAQYIRLKTVDLGYQFSGRKLPLGVNSLRLYLSAYNLLTWTNYNKYQQDPEISSNTSGDAYFNQRAVNLGLQIGL
ncbi:SusC/RagA family TonB-linked outer membrane protein [Sphingobacterium griseoflavum]|uniref:SusC/RagA family TonB-linked outer membrane protein n=1 Tax=Sphingobacterium griseoflavum TaxID=1474952 RepID=A0ABQ3HZU6_9SPHI|nr:TonB-dependent receptor [Sphingobacterium griseoflavum]GHE35742.1 SusC/RagA family TonB-linked outer membrane protein [Sphingobacterium griseoflavum]